MNNIKNRQTYVIYAYDAKLMKSQTLDIRFCGGGRNYFGRETLVLFERLKISVEEDYVKMIFSSL